MTIMTTTFVPCGAKLPIIAMIAGAFFGNSGWVATSSYFVGIAAIICSGIILKKTKMFAGDPAPFVMELPAYHWPTAGNILRSMWERGWSVYQKGRYDHPSFNHRSVVLNGLWMGRRFLWNGRGTEQQYPCKDRFCNCLDLSNLWAGQKPAKAGRWLLLL